MKLLIAQDQRYVRDAQGRVFGPQAVSNKFFQRYRCVFSEVAVLARMTDSGEEFPIDERVDGDGVSFIPLPDFRGAMGFLRRFFALRKTIREAVSQADACVLRVPSVVSIPVLLELERTERSLGVEVIGDPVGVFSARASSHPLRILLRGLFWLEVRLAARSADAVSYVADGQLPDRYPPGAKTKKYFASDVVLDNALLSESQLEARLKSLESPKSIFRLATVASLEMPYKGVDVMLRALARCKKTVNFEYLIAGKGALQDSYVELARSLSIEDRVRFLGHVANGKKLFEVLDTVDLYVQPSRTEGMPRALIEAMARGCPALATNVGGIPELLPPACLFESEDHLALADKIELLSKDWPRLREIAEHNVRIAAMYNAPRVAETRREFLTALREVAVAVGPAARAQCAE